MRDSGAIILTFWDTKRMCRPPFDLWIHGCWGPWCHPSWPLTSSLGDDCFVSLTLCCRTGHGHAWTCKRTLNGEVLLCIQVFVFFHRRVPPRTYLLYSGFNICLSTSVDYIIILRLRLHWKRWYKFENLIHLRFYLHGVVGILAVVRGREKIGKGFVYVFPRGRYMTSLWKHDR